MTELGAKLAASEARAESVQADASAADRDADMRLQEKSREVDEARAAAAAAAARHAAEAKELREELLGARQAARQAEASRDEYVQRLATARFEAEERMAAEAAAAEAAAAARAEAVAAAVSARLAQSASGASHDGGDAPMALASQPLVASVSMPRAGGSTGGSWAGARAAVEHAVLQIELGLSESTAREAEQRAALQAARHRAVVEPLIAQREQEVAWWKHEVPPRGAEPSSFECVAVLQG